MKINIKYLQNEKWNNNKKKLTNFSFQDKCISKCRSM